ncbi:hypothetical protein D3C86_641670 [compost metagenome]
MKRAWPNWRKRRARCRPSWPRASNAWPKRTRWWSASARCVRNATSRSLSSPRPHQPWRRRRRPAPPAARRPQPPPTLRATNSMPFSPNCAPCKAPRRWCRCRSMATSSPRSSRPGPACRWAAWSRTRSRPCAASTRCSPSASSARTTRSPPWPSACAPRARAWKTPTSRAACSCSSAPRAWARPRPRSRWPTSCTAARRSSSPST